MSFFEFFAQYNFHWRIYFFEYSELIIGLVCCFFSYRIGRVGLSVGVCSFLFLFKLLFDHFWLYYITLMQPNDFSRALLYQGMSLSAFLFFICVYFSHLRVKLEFSGFTVIFVSLHYSVMLLHFLLYFEYLYHGHMYVAKFYPYAVPALNSIAIIVLSFGVYFSLKKSKGFTQRIPWEWE